MLKILDDYGNILTRLILDPLIYFNPGMIAEKRLGNICVLSNGLIPYGIIDDIHNTKQSTCGCGYVHVWKEQVLAETDMFDLKCLNSFKAYTKGKASTDLYVNDGLLTTIRNDKKPIIGEFIEYLPNPDRIIFEWFGANIALQNKIEINSGINCSKCKDFNEYISEGNQPDGSYKCYKCRNKI